MFVTEKIKLFYFCFHCRKNIVQIFYNDQVLCVAEIRLGYSNKAQSAVWLKQKQGHFVFMEWSTENVISREPSGLITACILVADGRENIHML